MGNLKETHNVFLRFFFQKHFCVSVGKTLWKSQHVSLIGFSGGNATQHQQCQFVMFEGMPRLDLLIGLLEDVILWLDVVKVFLDHGQQTIY